MPTGTKPCQLLLRLVKGKVFFNNKYEFVGDENETFTAGRGLTNVTIWEHCRQVNVASGWLNIRLLHGFVFKRTLGEFVDRRRHARVVISVCVLSTVLLVCNYVVFNNSWGSDVDTRVCVTTQLSDCSSFCDVC